MATSWKFFLNSKAAWDAMYEDCIRARHSIDLEQFIFHDEPASQRFFDLFAQKAREGVRVRMFCDMVGSYSLYESVRARELREAGIQLSFYNPVSAWRIPNVTSWFFRDHRKLLIIDGATGHTGGVGINEKTTHWRDTNMRIMGPIVERMGEEFEKMWLGSLEKRFIGTRNPGEFLDQFMFLTNAPHPRYRHFYKALLRVVSRARREICITTPYFIPPLRILQALKHAARRGVVVRLLVPVTSDVLIADIGSQSFFGTIMKAGIRLFRYQNGVIHAKTTIIDDRWATIGSSNMDSQSFTFNHEANIVTTNLACVDELKTHFLNDLQNAQEMRRETWDRRSLTQKGLELLTWPIHWAL